MSEAEILKKLDRIESELTYIKNHLLDADLIITDDDLESIRDAERDLKKGKTKRIA
jgi:mRNA interferase RelE/StbE